MADIWHIYSTFRTRDEAVSAARMLLEARLIACANIHDGVTSLYRWEGAIQEEKEAVLLAKTSEAIVQKTIEAIRAAHAYELPCILAYPVPLGHPLFLDWVEKETKA